MIRNCKKKTEKQSWSTENMAAAIKDVMNGMRYRKAADIHKIPFITIIKKIKEAKREGLSHLEAAQKLQNCWSEKNMAAAIKDVANGMSYRKAADIHKIPFSTIMKKIKEAKREGLSLLEAAQKIRNCWSEKNMAAAIKDVMKGKISSRRAAAFHNVPRSTLNSRIMKAKKESLFSLEAVPKKLLDSYKTFSEAQEEELVKHILLLKERLFGLTLIDISKLAFEFAEKNNIRHHFNREIKKAGQKWLDDFFSRHKQLSHKMFEETSPASAKDFNRTAFQSFFNLLEFVYNKYKFLPNDIYNVDETGIIIEPKPSKVLALRGEKKQVDFLSSSENVLITAETCMSADGKYMPTMFIFPIKQVTHVLDDFSLDSFAVYHESGSIQQDSFITWFKKFIEFSHPQPEKPVLLLLDGHASHTKSVELIKLAQENNVIILSFPPHCTHWLQPLDVSFIPSLITYYEQEVQKWQNYYKQYVPMYKVSLLYEKAFSRAALRQRAIESFKKSGIYPLNRDVFADYSHAPSKTTVMPMHQEIQDDEAYSVISGNNGTQHPSIRNFFDFLFSRKKNI